MQKTIDVGTEELQESVSRKEILEQYINLDDTQIDDPAFKELIQDRRMAKQKIAGYTAELKSYLTKIQMKAAKLQADISDANGVIKYVDSKIVQRHIELTGVGK